MRAFAMDAPTYVCMRPQFRGNLTGYPSLLREPSGLAMHTPLEGAVFNRTHWAFGPMSPDTLYCNGISIIHRNPP